MTPVESAYARVNADKKRLTRIPSYKMDVAGVGQPIDMFNPQTPNPIPEVDPMNPMERKGFVERQMEGDLQRNVLLNQGVDMAQKSIAEDAATYNGYQDQIARGIEEMNATKAKADAAYADIESERRSDNARRRIGAVADAIAAFGNFYGVANGGYNQPEPKVYDLIDKRISSDANLRRANYNMLMQRLNNQQTELRNLMAQKYNEDRLKFWNTREGRLLDQGNRRIQNTADKLELQRQNQGFKNMLGLRTQEERETHNRNIEAIQQQNADTSRSRLGVAWYNAQNKGAAKKGGGSGKDPDADAKRTAASKGAWPDTWKKILKAEFGTDRPDVAKMSPEDFEKYDGMMNLPAKDLVEAYWDYIKGNGANAGKTAPYVKDKEQTAAPSEDEKTAPYMRGKGASGNGNGNGLKKTSWTR